MRNLRLLWLIPGFLPLVYKAPYLFQAWKQSPLDQWDWLFWLAALLLTAIRFRRIAEWYGNGTFQGLFLAVPSALLLAAAYWKDISTLFLIGGILFASSMLWIAAGKRMFVGTLPLFLLLLLGCPSTSYWCSYYLQSLIGGSSLPALPFKIAAAVVPATIFLYCRRPTTPVRLLFPAACLLLLALLVIQQRQPQFGQALHLDTELLQVGNYLGTKVTPTEQELRFFAGGKVERRTFFNDTVPVMLLAVQLGDDIHQIHPTELCLKSAGQQIFSSREIAFEVARNVLAVQEIEVQIGAKRYLIYTWYTGAKWSSGNFIAFRKAWTPGSSWNSYQLLTPIDTTDEEAGKRLQEFVREFAVSSPTSPDFKISR